MTAAEEMDVIYGKGVYEAGAIKNTATIQEAYKIGKGI